MPMKTLRFGSSVLTRSWPGLLAALFLWLPDPGFAQSAPLFTGGSVLPDGRGRFNLLVQTNLEHSFLLSSNLRDWHSVMVFQSPTPTLSITSDVPLVDLGPRMFFRAATGRILDFDLGFQFDIQAGTFAGGNSPSISYPVGITDYHANLDVAWETNPAPLTEVIFTGPPGSGLTSSPAAAVYPKDEGPLYVSANISSPPAPTDGSWTVQYRGENHIINPPPARTQEHFLLPVPTVTLSGGLLYSVAWTYRSPVNGATLGTPAFVTDVQVQIEGDDGFGMIGRLYDSPELPPTTTSHVIGDAIPWTDVTTLIMAYSDDLGNHYVAFYQKP